MKFVGEKERPIKSSFNKDQFGVKETKQPEEVKTVVKKDPKPEWVDVVTTTLVNLRSDSSLNSKAIMQIKGGIVVKMNASKNFGDFKQIKLGRYEGFVKSEYLKKI